MNISLTFYAKELNLPSFYLLASRPNLVELRIKSRLLILMRNSI